MTEWLGSLDRTLLYLLVLSGVVVAIALTGEWLRSRRQRPRTGPGAR